MENERNYICNVDKKEILVTLTDQWCDWEAAYAIAVANAFTEYTVKSIGIDTEPKVSMGGIKAAVDTSVSTYDGFDKLAMVILPGGLSWEEKEYDEIAAFVAEAVKRQIPVAAICGASLFLCKHGFLNGVKHTGDSLELFMKQKNYQGQEHYLPAQVVVDGGFITANETAAVEFAYEIFKMLEIDEPAEIEDWYDNFRNGAIRAK